MATFEEELAAEIKSAKTGTRRDEQPARDVAEERAAVIQARREVVAAFLRHMGEAGSPGLAHLQLHRRPPASRTPHHRRFRRIRPSDTAIRTSDETAYRVPHEPTTWDEAAGPAPDAFWVLTDGAVLWAGPEGVHEADIGDIVPLGEALGPSLDAALSRARGGS